MDVSTDVDYTTGLAKILQKLIILVLIVVCLDSVHRRLKKSYNAMKIWAERVFSIKSDIANKSKAECDDDLSSTLTGAVVSVVMSVNRIARPVVFNNDATSLWRFHYFGTEILDWGPKFAKTVCFIPALSSVIFV